MHPFLKASLYFSLHVSVLPPLESSGAIPKVGENAPSFTLEELLQAPDGASKTLEELRGKIVVLEFWATWCAPCRGVRPWFNKLEEKFVDKSVVFISVTNEDEKTVRRFIRKNPIHGWIGLDTDGSMFKSYGIEGRPRTVLIDREGKLVGWTIPHTLVNRPEILDELLAGKHPKGISSSPITEPPDTIAEFRKDLAGGVSQSQTTKSLCTIVVQPAVNREEPEVHTPSVNTAYTVRHLGVTKIEAIAGIFYVSYSHIVWEATPVTDRRYDIAFEWLAKDKRRGRDVLQQAVTGAFGLSAKSEKRLTDVYLLATIDGETPTLEPAMQGLLFDKETGKSAPTKALLERLKAGEELLISIGSTGSLARSLSSVFTIPVVDDVNVSGYYHFYFPFRFPPPSQEYALEVVQEALKRKYNLMLKPAKREVEMLVVENATPTK